MNVFWLKLSRKATRAEAARKAKAEKAALEKKANETKRMACKIVTMVAKELALQAAIRDDEAFVMLPPWGHKNILTNIRDLQKIHDNADVVQKDGRGVGPPMEHVKETLKTAREVATHIGGMVAIIRQAKDMD